MTAIHRPRPPRRARRVFCGAVGCVTRIRPEHALFCPACLSLLPRPLRREIARALAELRDAPHSPSALRRVHAALALGVAHLVTR